MLLPWAARRKREREVTECLHPHTGAAVVVTRHELMLSEHKLPRHGLVLLLLEAVIWIPWGCHSGNTSESVPKAGTLLALPQITLLTEGKLNWALPLITLKIQSLSTYRTFKGSTNTNSVYTPSAKHLHGWVDRAGFTKGINRNVQGNKIAAQSIWTCYSKMVKFIFTNTLTVVKSVTNRNE